MAEALATMKSSANGWNIEKFLGEKEKG